VSDPYIRTKGKYANGQTRYVIAQTINGKEKVIETVPRVKELLSMLRRAKLASKPSSSTKADSGEEENKVSKVRPIFFKRSSQMGQRETVTYAYIAGFVDADGCISFSKRNPRGRGTSEEFKPILSIVNTNEGIMDYLSEVLQSKYHKQEKEGNHKDVFQIKLYNRKAYEMVKLLYPFLKLKKPQAQRTIDFYEGKIDDTSPVSKKEIERRQMLFDEMKKLNKKGKEVEVTDEQLTELWEMSK